MAYKKYIRDGNVAVLITAGYGSGWFTYHQIEELLFSPEIVEMILSTGEEYLSVGNCDHFDIANQIDVYLEKYNTQYLTVESCDLEIQWVPEGEEFYIDEYDGYESVMMKSKIKWIVA